MKNKELDDLIKVIIDCVNSDMSDASEEAEEQNNSRFDMMDYEPCKLKLASDIESFFTNEGIELAKLPLSSAAVSPLGDLSNLEREDIEPVFHSHVRETMEAHELDMIKCMDIWRAYDLCPLVNHLESGIGRPDPHWHGNLAGNHFHHEQIEELIMHMCKWFLGWYSNPES